MKRILYVLYILVIAIVLIPKEKMFYTLEGVLAENQIFLNNETLSDRFISLEIDNTQVMADHLNVAGIKQIRFTPWIIYNRFSLSEIEVSPQFRTFFPGKADNVVVSYSILHPLSLSIRADGDFGSCEGSADLIKGTVRVVFAQTPKLRNYPLLVLKLHQEKEGMVYESDF